MPDTINLDILWQEILKFIAINKDSPLPKKFELQLSKLSKAELQQFINKKNQNNMALLHYAVTCGSNDSVEWLIQKEANINLQYNDGCTPLTLAILAEKPELIKKLIQRGADLHAKDKEGLTPILLAAKIANPKVIQALKESGVKFTFEVFGAYAKLFRVFGGKKIVESSSEKINVNQLEGSNGASAMADLTQRFQEFSKTQLTPNKAKYYAITKVLKTLINDSNEDLILQIKKKQAGEFTLIRTGFKEHYFPAIFHKTDNGKIQLSLVDRGAFHEQIAGQAYNSEENSGPCITTIEIPERNLEKVIELLIHAKSVGESEAKDIFFREIPKITGKKYETDQKSQQKTFKTGICFYSNNKSVIRFLLIRFFGDEKGEELYKIFTLFERQQELKAFRNLKVEEGSKQIEKINNAIETAEKILEIKEIKLLMQTKQFDTLISKLDGLEPLAMAKFFCQLQTNLEFQTTAKTSKKIRDKMYEAALNNTGAAIRLLNSSYVKTEDMFKTDFFETSQIATILEKHAEKKRVDGSQAFLDNIFPANTKSEMTASQKNIKKMLSDGDSAKILTSNIKFTQWATDKKLLGASNDKGTTKGNQLGTPLPEIEKSRFSRQM